MNPIMLEEYPGNDLPMVGPKDRGDARQRWRERIST